MIQAPPCTYLQPMVGSNLGNQGTLRPVVLAGSGTTSDRRVSSLRAIVFGMEDVLYDGTAWQRWLARVLGQLGRPVEFVSFFEPWKCDYLPEVYRGNLRYEVALFDFLTASGLTSAEISEFENTCHKRRRAAEASLRPLPGVCSTIAALHARGYQLAVLADSEHRSSVLREHLQQLRVEPYMAHVVSSRDVGCAQPDPRCCQAVQEMLGIPARHIAFVGDSTASLSGAYTSGWRTFALSSAGRFPLAEAVIRSFDDLLTVIGEPRLTTRAA